MQVIEGVVPPSGWHYMQGAYRVDGADYRDLLQKVLEWRLANNFPVGNVQNDVDGFVCKNWPTQCHQASGEIRLQIPRAQRPQAPSKTDILTQWALAMQRNPGIGDLESDDVANCRATVCLECPRNVTITHGCGTCYANLERLLTILRKGKDHSAWKRLHFCSATQQDSRTIIWLKKELLRKDGDLWDKCWLK